MIQLKKLYTLKYLSSRSSAARFVYFLGSLKFSKLLMFSAQAFPIFLVIVASFTQLIFVHLINLLTFYVLKMNVRKPFLIPFS